MITSDVGTSIMIAAEGAAEEAAKTGWSFTSVDTQVVISTYLLMIATVLGVTIEIYKLSKIEHELKIIRRLLDALTRTVAPLRRHRSPVRQATRIERKLSRRARRNVVDLPTVVAQEQHKRNEAARAKIRSYVINNDRRY